MTQPAGTEVTAEVLNLITEWNLAKQQMGNLRTKEAYLRKQIVEAFPTRTIEGTMTHILPSGWKLKIRVGLNRKIDEAALSAVAEKACIPVENFTTIKYEVSISKYKKLNEAIKPIIDEALIITPKTPTVELVAPHEDKTK